MDDHARCLTQASAALSLSISLGTCLTQASDDLGHVSMREVLYLPRALVIAPLRSCAPPRGTAPPRGAVPDHACSSDLAKLFNPCRVALAVPRCTCPEGPRKTMLSFHDTSSMWMPNTGAIIV